MIMSMYKKICITNRSLVHGNFLDKLEEIVCTDVDIIVLREKDLSQDEYLALAKQVIQICKNNGKLCILHSFIDVALALNYDAVHLTYEAFRALDEETKKHFKIIGVSTHSVEEAIACAKLGATYITASHIFPTDCKRDLAPRGLEYLRDVKQNVDIPVYALGGIHPDNIDLCLKAGADGVCMMSEYMV